MGDPGLVGNLQIGRKKGFLDLPFDLRIQQGDLDEVVLPQRGGADAQLIRDQTRGGDTAAFAVPAVVHLHAGLEHVAALHRHAGGEPHDAAAAFFDAIALLRRGKSLDQPAARGQDVLHESVHGAYP